VATALIRPLAWESPYAAGAAQEMAQRQKKKEEEKEEKESRCQDANISNQFKFMAPKINVIHPPRKEHRF